MDISSSEPFDVRGELVRVGWSKTASSGPLECCAEPDKDASSSSISRPTSSTERFRAGGDEGKLASMSCTDWRLW